MGKRAPLIRASERTRIYKALQNNFFVIFEQLDRFICRERALFFALAIPELSGMVEIVTKTGGDNQKWSYCRVHLVIEE